LKNAHGLLLAACLVVPHITVAKAPSAVPAPVSGSPTGNRTIGLEHPPWPTQPNGVIRRDSALDTLIAPGTVPEILAEGFNSTEGPMWRDGRLWVSDQRAGQVYAIDDKGTKTVIAENTGVKPDPAITVNQGPNGQAPDKGGAVLIMRQGLRDVGRMTPDGRFYSFLSRFEGKRFNSPNDMVYAQDGTLFFTDPAYSLPGGMDGPNSELHFEGVFSYKDGELQAVVKDLTRPNGIGISPSGRILYISTATPSPRIKAYDIQKDGTVANGRDFYVWPMHPGERGGVDGLKIDELGNLWATGVGGVNVITPEGKNLGVIQVKGVQTSNVTFGGADNRTLFITGATYVYRIPTLVKGLPLLYYK